MPTFVELALHTDCTECKKRMLVFICLIRLWWQCERSFTSAICFSLQHIAWNQIVRRMCGNNNSVSFYKCASVDNFQFKFWLVLSLNSRYLFSFRFFYVRRSIRVNLSKEYSFFGEILNIVHMHVHPNLVSRSASERDLIDLEETRFCFTLIRFF